MSPTFKPKRFDPVFAYFDGDGGVTFSTSQDGPRLSHPPADKPVLTLLASVSHCLLESLRIVARQDGVTLPAFSVSAGAEKAMDMPGRLQSVDCVVRGVITDDPQSAKQMVYRAKEICTVSNTLNCTIQLDLRPA